MTNQNPQSSIFQNALVEVIGSYGSDLSIVNAARVSLSRESKMLTAQDIRLLIYLEEHRHWTPFAHAGMSFRITMPIFVARQLMRSTVGIVVNEMSRRYVKSTPKCYAPEQLRKQSPLIKQGSLDEQINQPLLGKLIYKATCGLSLLAYKALLKLGVCAEQARAILPQCTMTTIIWTGSLEALRRLYASRTHSHAQKEITDVVMQMAKHAENKFPQAWRILKNGAADD